jgi:hypothetical protein
MTPGTLAYVFSFTVIFEIFRAILKNKDNMAPKAKDNMAKSQLFL